MPADLVEFLRERLQDDERDAGDIHDTSLCDTVPRYGGITGPCDCGWPQRMIDDITAKRSILDECEDRIEAGEIQPGTSWNDDAAGAEMALVVLHFLVQPYASHPDYDPAWNTATQKA